MLSGDMISVIVLLRSGPLRKRLEHHLLLLQRHLQGPWEFWARGSVNCWRGHGLDLASSCDCPELELVGGKLTPLTFP